MGKQIVLSLVACVPTLAYADANPKVGSQDDGDSRSRVAVTIGLATPTGELGIEYRQGLSRFLEIGVGAGIGVSGPQVSLMPRLRIGSRRVSLTVGAGISGGPFTTPRFYCIEECEAPTKTTVLWTSFEAGLELTSVAGAALRIYGGFGKLMAHGTCDGPECSTLDSEALPYLGIGVGRVL